jgi:hypothetical protein
MTHLNMFKPVGGLKIAKPLSIVNIAEANLSEFPKTNTTIVRNNKKECQQNVNKTETIR